MCAELIPAELIPGEAEDLIVGMGEDNEQSGWEEW